MCFSRLSLVVTFSLALQSCASVAPRNAVPEELVGEAMVLPGTHARMWGDVAPENFDELVEIFRKQLVRDGGDEALSLPRNMLLISGGGANGAFGGGLLKGWTESGTRPELTIVTGISTGALIAPYAFLGSDYDDELEMLYTTLSTKDIVKERPLLAGLRGDALADTRPLRELLRNRVDEAMIAEIGIEHEKGRRLLIGTTNLDAKRPVIWNIGAIAAEGTEESAQLIRDVMLASASIPGLFPPVRINVRVGDRTYDELHVDGGVASQVFLYPAQVDLKESARTVGTEGKLTMYVIRNSILAPRWSEVKPKVVPVALASISTLIRTQGMGDLYRLYLGAKRDSVSFRLAYIPETFDLEPEEEFDPKYMKALFDLGYNMARDGYEWERSPPGVALP
jgi:predicted acylesterase/phospholipase RssA